MLGNVVYFIIVVGNLFAAVVFSFGGDIQQATYHLVIASVLMQLKG